MASKHRKQRRGDISMTTGIVIGVVISVFITFLLAAFSALLVANEHLPISSMGYTVILIWVVSALVGGITAGRMVLEKKLVTCLIVCGVYLLLLFGLAIALFDGLEQTVWMGTISVLIGCAGAVLIAIKPKKGTRRLKMMRVSR